MSPSRAAISTTGSDRNALTVRRKELGEEKPLPPKEFRALVKEKMALLKMDESFAGRYLNDGFRSERVDRASQGIGRGEAAPAEGIPGAGEGEDGAAQDG